MTTPKKLQQDGVNQPSPDGQLNCVVIPQKLHGGFMLDPNRPFIDPIVTIQINQMKASIMHYIHTNHEELNKRLDAACEKAIQDFNFDGEVTKAINFAISEAIKAYFSYGDGSTAIQQCVKDLLKTAKTE